MKPILTIEEVRKALYLDYDYDVEELEKWSLTASAFLLEKTGYDFSEDKIIHPLAKLAAEKWIATEFYSGENYKREFDYAYGLTSLINDLQQIGKDKIKNGGNNA